MFTADVNLLILQLPNNNPQQIVERIPKIRTNINVDQQHPCVQSSNVVFVIQEGKQNTANEEIFLNLDISEWRPLSFPRYLDNALE